MDIEEFNQKLIGTICIAILLALTILFISLNCGVFIERTVQSVKVQDVQYYKVYTNEGAFTIKTDGIFAHPELFPIIEKDSTYTFITRGLQFNFINVHPCIVRVIKK